MYHYRPSRPAVVQLKLLLSHLSLGVGCGGACVLGILDTILIPVCLCYQFSSQLGKYMIIMSATGAILATGFQLSGK
jgi:hypothetical protein